MTVAVEVDGLSKSFAGHKALDSVGPHHKPRLPKLPGSFHV